MGFHRNYRPALIMFNGKSGTEGTGLSGIYDPQRVMNATLFGFGYRLDSLEYGLFEAKVLTAHMNASMPESVHAYYASAEGNKPVGYHGSNLGIELDVKYGATPSREFEYGIEAGYARGGDALKVSDSAPATSVLVQSYAAFKF